MRVEWLLAGLTLLFASAALAEDDEEPKAARAKPKPEQYEVPAGGVLRANPRTAPRLKTAEGKLLTTGDSVSASDALDEMLDELSADLARLGATRLSPILLDRVRLSDNMEPEFAAILEARLATALMRGANAAVIRCQECWAARSRVEKGEWVVARGITRKEDLDELAEKYEARTLLSVALTLNTDPNSLAMDVELVRAEDSAIVFAESYRVHPHTAMLYRGADSAQSREEKLRDLEARIDGRPMYGHGVMVGTMLVPSDGSEGWIWGAFLDYRVFEKFGPEREYRLGINGGGFLNTSRLAGAILGLSLQWRLNEENVYAPSLWLGGSASGFLTGSAGNSALLALNVEYQMVHRFAIQGSLGYLVPFQLGGKGETVGGVVPQLGGAVTW